MEMEAETETSSKKAGGIDAEKCIVVVPSGGKVGDDLKLEVLETFMNENDVERFDCYIHSGLPFKTVRSIMQRISLNIVDGISALAMCDLAKDFVEEVLSAAIDYKEENARNENRPLTPEEILCGYYKLKFKKMAEENLEESQAEKKE